MTAVTVAALVLELAFVGLGFGGRALHQFRRTGDWGMRRPAGLAARAAMMLMVVGLVTTGSAPLVELLDVGPGLLTEVPLLRVGGVVVLVAAIAGTIHAQLVLGASWRVGVDPDETLTLVTAGPFGVVRNPIFAWMLVSVVGVGAAVPSVVALVGAGLALAGVEIQVRAVEEPYLRRTHGADYQEYTARVGRFLPGMGRSGR